jgi:hypothetical protein
VTVSGRRFSLPLTTTPAPTPVVSPVPSAVTSPAPAPVDDCSAGPSDGGATATLAPASGRPGDTITVTIVTTGPGCTNVADEAQLWWTRPDGTPIPVDWCSNTVVVMPQPPTATCTGYFDPASIPPGNTLVDRFAVTRGMQPGTYIATTQLISTEFTVLAPPT